MFRPLAVALLIAAPLSPLSAQKKAAPEKTAESSQPPQRVRNAVVFGDDPCPKSVDGEIVVCSRMPADEQFRIPKRFRQGPPSAANQSWVNRAATIDEIGRTAGGLPDTCSVIGSGGQTGCTAQMLRQFSAERRAKKAEQADIP